MELFFGSFQSAGRKSKSCQHILDILPAEYVAIYYIISIYIFIYTCTFGLVTRFCQQNIVLSHVKLSPWSTSFLGPMELFLVGLILPAEYPNSAGRILRFCRQNIEILPAEYCAISYDISSYIYICTLLGRNSILPAESEYFQQNIHIILAQSYIFRLLVWFCWQSIQILTAEYWDSAIRFWILYRQNILPLPVLYLYVYTPPLSGL